LDIYITKFTLIIKMLDLTTTQKTFKQNTDYQSNFGFSMTKTIKNNVLELFVRFKITL